MALNPIDELKYGNIDFMYHLTPNDLEITKALIRTSLDKKEIIKKSLKKLIKDFPDFTFEIIYDMDEYSDIAIKLSEKINIDYRMFSNILDDSIIAFDYIIKNIDKLLNDEDRYITKISSYALSNNNEYLIKLLSRNSNLHVRYLFMKELITNYYYLIDTIYDDITKYMTSISYELFEQLTFLPVLMDIEEISDIAVLLLLVGREEDYEKLKTYIIKEYKYNYLAANLLTKGLEDRFKDSSDILFKTSKNYRLNIYLDYEEMVSRELIEDFSKRLRVVFGDNYYELNNIYLSGLGPLLEEYIDKYLSLSKSKEYTFLGSGTTCSCYRLGDYVIKLVRTKWSYEDVICPNLFLIVKNLEEKYIRDKKGIVIAGLEVQKYLSRSSKDIDEKYFELFNQELDRLGYRHNDTLRNGSCGDNTFLLDTYLDADINDPQRLPDWFKRVPLVLVDRDRVYKKDSKRIRQLNSNIGQ